MGYSPLSNLQNTPYFPSTQTLYSFASQFPKAAYSLFEYAQSSLTCLSQLSPKAQANLHKLSLLGYRGGIYLFGISKQVYVYIMRIPKRPITQWTSPTGLILYPLSRMVLFTLPVDSQVSPDTLSQLREYNKNSIKDSTKDKSRVFVCNRNVYSLDVLPLLCWIYKETGIWPRVAMDVYHFKIPLWKHLIEYFGAFPQELHTIDKVIQAKQPVLLAPGGLKESLKTKEQLVYSTTTWETGYLSSISSDCSVVPVSCIGFNDMFEHVYDVDISVGLWCLGYRNVKQTVPLLYPKSFQKSFVHVGPVQESLVEADAMESVQQGITYLQEKQASDPKRYLLTKMGHVLKKGNGWVLQKLKNVETKRVLAAGGQQVYSWSVYFLEKLDLQ